MSPSSFVEPMSARRNTSALSGVARAASTLMAARLRALSTPK
jgi:hypothetical protein